jgi:hypothetical protein
MGKEEENSGFEARKKELEDGGIEKPGQEENRVKEYLKAIQSSDVMIPDPVEITLPNYPEKIKVIELSASKHLQFEKLMNELDGSTVNDLKGFEKMTFNDIHSFHIRDAERIMPIVIAICDNEMNPFVDKEFCDRYISMTIATKIIHTYVVKFFIPCFVQQMLMRNFHKGALVLSNPGVPKTGSEVGA